jgi:DNA-binding MarR family transcriptional regulator
MAQFNILRILRGAKDFININTVKDRMVEKSPNSTRLMDKLLEKQLIERKRCEIDRRVVYVKISELGLKLLAKIDESFDDNLLFANKLNNQETILLNQLLDKVRS